MVFFSLSDSLEIIRAPGTDAQGTNDDINPTLVPSNPRSICKNLGSHVIMTKLAYMEQNKRRKAHTRFLFLNTDNPDFFSILASVFSDFFISFPTSPSPPYQSPNLCVAFY